MRGSECHQGHKRIKNNFLGREKKNGVRHSLKKKRNSIFSSFFGKRARVEAVYLLRPRFHCCRGGQEASYHSNLDILQTKEENSWGRIAPVEILSLAERLSSVPQRQFLSKKKKKHGDNNLV